MIDVFNNFALFILLYSLLLGAVSYFLVWTVHNASIFENFISWAQGSETFVKRLIACYVCFTYHISLAVVSLFAIMSDWDPGQWFLVWCLSCTVSLTMYSRRVIADE